MNQITFGYSDSEDRLWLSLSQGEKYWLTRRLLSGFLPQVAELMTSTVPGGEIPNALPTRQRIELEHEEALADSPDGAPALELNKETHEHGEKRSRAPQLANTLTVSAGPMQCELIVIAAGSETRFTLNRLEFHRLLGAIAKVTAHADWRLAGLPAWLDESTSE